jgi:cell division protease FtsH
VGPPGTGKTLLARAVAGEAGVPFFSISGSDFVEMFVGVGASRVRDLFLQGKKNAPCIIFIDEIDAVGRHRGAGLGGGHDEREQTLNQLLVEMDGFESNEGVIMIAATNRPDVLDPALLRPGRFDRRVVVPRPDLRGRLAILKVHTRRVPLSDDVQLEVVARGTPGFVGADLQNLVNESALLAARRDAQRVHQEDFERAKDKVLLGTERRSMIMSDEDKRVAAFHEAGHALVALLNEHSDPVHKVTIIPRGMALGVTQTLPEEDRYNLTRAQMVATIRYAMGGRAAEELVFQHLSTGAANDLQQATKIAHEMVCTYGMSERIGPVSFSDDSADVFLGRDFVSRKNYSEQKAREIDEELTRILSENYDSAKQTLSENLQVLERIAEALLERETLEGADLALLLAGRPLPPLPEPEIDASASPTSDRPRRSETAREFPGEKLPDPEPVAS